MAISLASLRRGPDIRPPIMGIYGTHGVGKTSLAAEAPAPVMLQWEDGRGQLETPTFGLLRSYQDGMEAIASLYNEPHDFRNVIVDTIDHLEPIIWAETCRRYGWDTIDSNDKGSPTAYGKGYLAAAAVWREFFDGMKDLRNDRGMGIIMLAHAEVKKFEPPDSEAYDRYQPKIQKSASAYLQESVDCMFFNHRLISTVKADPKDTKSKTRGVGGGQRVIYTEERPAYMAKNRFGMPHQILLPDSPATAWAALSAHLPYFNRSMKEAA